MATPKRMTKAIKNRTITSEILGACTYSINKRAKNCRDNVEKSRHSFEYDYYNNAEKNEKKKKYYYAMKDSFLNILEPVCIHRVHGSKSVYDGRTYICEDKVIFYCKYYKVGEYGFHRPLKDGEPLPDLPIEDIGELTTYGRDIKGLLSVQFCEKVLALINSGDYTYIP